MKYKWLRTNCCVKKIYFIHQKNKTLDQFQLMFTIKPTTAFTDIFPGFMKYFINEKKCRHQ